MYTIMKKFFLALVLFQSAIAVHSQTNNEFSEATKKWFGAWELLSRDVYGLTKFYPVDFIFFDSVNVYSTSIVSVSKGEPVNGQPIMGETYQWKKALHNGTLILPDSTRLPVGMMSFAGENKLTNKPFFIMPLPSFWKAVGVKSEELGVENLATGVFLHEFSHSQQMQNFGKRIAEYERTTNFGDELTDDIVQELFQKDSVYTSLFREETTILFNVATNADKNMRKKEARGALTKMNKRQATYFTGKFKDLALMDDFFLTMEGLGQYSMYAWFVHPKGGNMPADLVTKGVRRGKKQWSQDEGFALFLLLEKYASPEKWGAGMFANKVTSVKELLVKYLNSKK